MNFIIEKEKYGTDLKVTVFPAEEEKNGFEVLIENKTFDEDYEVASLISEHGEKVSCIIYSPKKHFLHYSPENTYTFIMKTEKYTEEKKFTIDELFGI